MPREVKMAQLSDQDRLERTIRARYPCIAVSTFEEEYVMQLARGVAVELQCDLFTWSVTQGVCDALLAGAPPVVDTDHPAAALVTFCQPRQKRGIFVMLDLVGHLKDERTLRAYRDAVEAMAKSNSVLILIESHAEFPPAVNALAQKFEVSFPDETELIEIIKSTLHELNQQQRVTADISKKGLQQVLRNLRGLTRRQARQIVIDTVCDDCRFDESDIPLILAEKRKALSGAGLLEYVESPTTLDEVGGLEKLKGWLGQRQNALSDDAARFGITPPRGVLMLGVQGAGKSLAAKAVATAWQRPLLRMDVGSLYDKYIGQSERQLRDALRQAEMMSPIVLWIDEIEKGFASAASESTDGGLSKRMFGCLLTWMQEHTAPVFLIATANDIEALPPELLRKGRFDEIFFVDLPAPAARKQIFSIHLKKRGRDPGKFDLEALATASDGFSGAEIEQAIYSALHEAFSAGEELNTKHILDALKESPPLSVTMREKVEELREWSKGRCVCAD
jgi:SpoVK/Ycf46/Vps4 family AAA+-type ATPase